MIEFIICLFGLILLVYLVMEISHWLVLDSFLFEILFIKKTFLKDLKKLCRKNWWLKPSYFGIERIFERDWKGKNIRNLGYKIYVYAENNDLKQWTNDIMILDNDGHIIEEKLTNNMVFYEGK